MGWAGAQKQRTSLRASSTFCIKDLALWQGFWRGLRLNRSGAGRHLKVETRLSTVRTEVHAKCTEFASCLRPLRGLVWNWAGRSGTVRRLHNLRCSRASNSRMAQGCLELSTGNCPVFRSGCMESQRKYKILWFVVDLHHRQRYFFICGCNRIVTRLQPERLERACCNLRARGKISRRISSFNSRTAIEHQALNCPHRAG